MFRTNTVTLSPTSIITFPLASACGKKKSGINAGNRSNTAEARMVFGVIPSSTSWS